MDVRSIVNKLPGTIRIFKPNAAILYQGEIPRSGFFIKKGIVKAYSLQSTGDEQIATFFGPGDFFPMPWLFNKSSTSVYYHESLNTCELVAVTRDDMQKYMLSDNELKNAMLDQSVKMQAAYLLRITALEQPRASEKILFTIYYLLFLFGETKDQVTYKINFKLTHAVIASLVGLTRETTATELHKLKSKGIISYSQKIYTVDKPKLEASMGEDSFSELLKY